MILHLREANMNLANYDKLCENINRKTRGTACYFNSHSFGNKRYFKISKEFINILDEELKFLENFYIKNF